MTQQEILNANKTKTWKIQQLFVLGLTRKQVAQAMEVGYGFVQNVYAKTNPELIVHRVRLATGFVFNHRFGVEIEAFNVTKNELLLKLSEIGISVQTAIYSDKRTSLWRIKSDSSIRGNDTFELVSPILQGTEGLEELKKVCQVLKRCNAKINRSCGLHIHFDAQGFGMAVWKRLYLNYALIEEQIDSFMPESRRDNNNTYCRSMRVSDFRNKINLIDDTNVNGGLVRLENLVTNRGRTYKLNSQSYWKQKSVEFRQHSGSIEYEKISNWILFLARFVEFSKTSEIAGENWEAIKGFIPEELSNYFEQRKLLFSTNN